MLSDSLFCVILVMKSQWLLICGVFGVGWECFRTEMAPCFRLQGHFLAPRLRLRQADRSMGQS